ncbi:TPA: hypothetical protein N0F65_005552 [Lagenidium giganteum]|uniref:Uncharacterized protein n=1 Tax=Lagenidium giganteum TaxID=4803 RepID=A0AAV2YRL4_9STRA|nr:TPA: hypothetical protein N0F65_005552 [Lagenidium giganteum]
MLGAPSAHPYHHWKYNHPSANVARLLEERSVRGNGRAIDVALQGHGSMLRRLRCETVLAGHEGCVNHLRWNRNGSLLASGSDDTKVIMWDYATRKQREVIDTGHTMNIFAVCFVPDTNDHIIASGAMDCQVQIHYAPFRPEATKSYRLHNGRVKDLGCSWGVPKVFWSVAEDGLVYQFDVRALPRSDGTNRAGDDSAAASGVLIRLGTGRRGRTLRGMGMATHPLDPTKIVLACGDFYSRLYDRRMLRIQQHTPTRRTRREATSVGATIPLQVFAPPHLHLDQFAENKSKRRHDDAHGTSIQFSSDGSHVLANYHNDHIYLFSVAGGASADTTVQYKKPTVTVDAQTGDPSDPAEEGKTVPKGSSEEAQATTQEAPKAPAWRNGMGMDLPWKPVQLTTDQVLELYRQGTVAMLNDKMMPAVRLLTRACNASCLASMPASFQKDLYHDTAKAYLKRGWNADVYLAAVFTKLALEVCPDDFDVELTYIKALHQDSRLRHADVVASHFQCKYPNDADEVEEYLGSSRRSSRLSNEGSTATEQYPSDDEGFWVCPEMESRPVNCDPARRYIGYCNVQTDIKEATFFGKNDEYIVAGSDDGRAFMWNKATGELASAIEADADIVNCVQCHPFDSCLATSGIENVIRLWTPTAEKETAPREDELDELANANQKQMGETYDHFFGDPSRNIYRLIFQGAQHEGMQECATQ